MESRKKSLYKDSTPTCCCQSMSGKGVRLVCFILSHSYIFLCILLKKKNQSINGTCDHNFSEFQKVLTVLTTNCFVCVICDVCLCPKRWTVLPVIFIKIKAQDLIGMRQAFMATFFISTSLFYIPSLTHNSSIHLEKVQVTK